MRKQDRIAREQQNQSNQQPDSKAPARESEKVKGSSSDQPSKPPRQSGKLPLPD